MTILIKNTMALLPKGEVQQCSIVIENNKIAKILKTLPDLDKYDKIIDGKDTFTLPGFVNTHTHAAMTLLRSYADDMHLMDWLNNKIWPIEGKMKKADIYWGSMLAIVEMLKSGTTTFCDMYADMEEVARASIETDIRCVLSRGMIGINPNGLAALEENVELYKNFHNTNNEKIKVMFAPHAPYTCPPDFLKKVLSKSEAYEGKINIHLAETKFEVDECKKIYKMTPIKLMESVGLFERGVVAAHCVHVDDEDIDILKKYDVHVAHNPTSNLKLASGIAPIDKMLKKEIVVGLGTDGASSNNNLDMLEEINLTALIHKGYNYDPLCINANKAIEMGTVDGAKVLFMDKIGEIKEDNIADLIMIDTSDISLQPIHNLVSLLVYAAKSSMTKNVIIDGKLIMENRNLLHIDEEKVKYMTNKITQELFSR